MKKSIILFFTIISSLQLFSQEEKGFEVDYKTVMFMDAEMVINKIPAQYRSQVESSIREEIKKGISMEYKLLTNGKKSHYQLQPKINNSQGVDALILNQLASQDKGALYKDLEDLSFLKEYNVMGTEYLIKGDLTITNWRILKETAMIGGYATRKAEGIANDSIKVTAWFCPKIAVKDGPDRVFGLPGLVLKTTYELNSVDFVTEVMKIVARKEKIKFKKTPSKKTITQSEFDQKMEDLEKKMREMHSSGVDKDN